MFYLIRATLSYVSTRIDEVELRIACLMKPLCTIPLCDRKASDCGFAMLSLVNLGVLAAMLRLFGDQSVTIIIDQFLHCLKEIMESNAQDANALAMLCMLEERLHRLEFLLHGSSNAFGVPDPAPEPAAREEAISTRLTSLESNLHRLALKHGVVQDILDLCTRLRTLVSN
jgi:hypothetical protein